MFLKIYHFCNELNILIYIEHASEKKSFHFLQFSRLLLITVYNRERIESGRIAIFADSFQSHDFIPAKEMVTWLFEVFLYGGFGEKQALYVSSIRK